MSPKSSKPSGIVSRRQQVKKANTTVFAAVAIGAVIVMFSLNSIRFLWGKKSYNDRVVVAKTKARDDIQTNAENLKKLAEQFPSLEGSATTNSKTILHALPPVYDYAALASSVDYLANEAGVATSVSIGQDISASAVKSAVTSQPVELPLSLQVSGSYDAVQTYILTLERSIRPMRITNVSYTGSSQKLQAVVQAVTYYQPVRALDVTKQGVQ